MKSVIIWKGTFSVVAKRTFQAHKQGHLWTRIEYPEDREKEKLGYPQNKNKTVKPWPSQVWQSMARAIAICIRSISNLICLVWFCTVQITRPFVRYYLPPAKPDGEIDCSNKFSNISLFRLSPGTEIYRVEGFFRFWRWRMDRRRGLHDALSSNEVRGKIQIEQENYW